MKDLLNCPHCGGKAIFKLECKHFTKRLNKKVQYARIYCENNNPFSLSDRCLCKTVVAPVEEVIQHWNNRKDIYKDKPTTPKAYKTSIVSF